MNVGKLSSAVVGLVPCLLTYLILLIFGSVILSDS